MALNKTDILSSINTLLADFSNIQPSEHRQAVGEIIDKVYDENIDSVSLVGTDLIFTRDGGTGAPITVDLSGLSGAVDSVNSKTGDVVIDGTDIPLLAGTTTPTVTGAIADLDADVIVNSAKISYTDAAQVATNTSDISTLGTNKADKATLLKVAEL